MKRFKYIVCLMLLVLAQMASAKTELVSNDPNWLGGRATFNTTEGNDFWLTFMNNNTFDPDAPDNKSIKFEMQIAISASETMDVAIAIGNSTKTVTVPANETYIYELDRDDASQIYLLTSEKDGYQGVHVYSAQKDKDKFFSCFLYNIYFRCFNCLSRCGTNCYTFGKFVFKFYYLFC